MKAAKVKPGKSVGCKVNTVDGVYEVVTKTRGMKL